MQKEFGKRGRVVTPVPPVTDVARPTRDDGAAPPWLMIALVVAAVAVGAAGTQVLSVIRQAGDGPDAGVAAGPAASRPTVERPAAGGVTAQPAVHETRTGRNADSPPLPDGPVNVDQAVDELRRYLAYDSDLCIPGRREEVVVAYRDYARVRTLSVNRARASGGDEAARAEAGRWRSTDAWLTKRLTDLANSGYFLFPTWMRPMIGSELPFLRDLPRVEDRCPGPGTAGNGRPRHPDFESFRRSTR